MQSGIVLSQADVKTIIAEKFGVEEDKIICSKYSWIVIGADEKKDNEASKESI